MTEVIDLISSSPPRSTATASLTGKAQNTSNIFDFDSDNFDTTGDLDFLIDQPSKKRRISPTLRDSTRSNNLSPVNSVFDLSSEPDALPDLAHMISMTSRPQALRSVSVSGHDLEEARDDPFPFSSSAPELTRKRTSHAMFVLDDLSDVGDSVEDSVQGSLANIKRAALDEKTSNLSATGVTKSNSKSLSSRTAPKTSKSTSTTSSTRIKRPETELERSERFMKAAKAVVDDILDSSQPGPSSKTTSRASKKAAVDNHAKSSVKAAAKAAKDVEKELEKERKKQERELKKQDKQRAADIAEVNKSKTNKKNSTPEMVLLMPTTLQGKSLSNQVEEYMKQLDVELIYEEDDAEEVDLSATTDVSISHGAIIRWRRKVTAEYDEDQEEWHPLLVPRVSKEAHIIVYFKAEDFVKLAVIGISPTTDSMVIKDVSENTMKANLNKHISALRRKHPNCRPIYLIEGLTAWNKRSLNAKNRAYTAAVRSQLDPSSTFDSTTTTSSQPRRRKKTSDPVLDLTSITEETTEALLLHLQLHHQPLLIHHTTSPTTSATQISTYTQHLSTRPYRLAAQNTNLSSASFCMTTGQIRTGSTTSETWINMLQEINRVTPSMAYGITGAGYKNPTELVNGFKKHGREMLEDVRKSVNKDGGWSDRKLGGMVSKRVHKVFMGVDPGARDGIA